MGSFALLIHHSEPLAPFDPASPGKGPRLVATLFLAMIGRIITIIPLTKWMII